MIKLLKYFFALLFSGLVLIGCSVFALYYFNSQDIVTEETVREVQNSNQILSNPLSAFSQLSEEEQQAYLRITNEIDHLNDTFLISGNNVNEEQINKIINAILSDHPEYFFIKNVEYLKKKDGTVESVTINYNTDKETIATQQQEVEAWRDAIFAGITPEMNNADIALYLHDYIVNTTEYDLNANNNQNLLSVVESQASVCAGYTKAYQYLLNQAGIFSTYVSGNVGSGNQIEPHAWNLVQIDGEYGWIDITWDDPSFSGSIIPDGLTSHTYFGISTDDLLINHMIDPEFNYIGNVVTPSFNYYIKNNLFYDLSDSNQYYNFLGTVQENQNNGKNLIEIKLANEGQEDILLDKLSYEPFLFNNSINYIRDQYYPIITFLLN